MLRDLNAHVEQAERAFASSTIEEFVRLEVEAHAAYYEHHPVSSGFGSVAGSRLPWSRS